MSEYICICYRHQIFMSNALYIYIPIHTYTHGDIYTHTYRCICNIRINKSMCSVWL